MQDAGGQPLTREQIMAVKYMEPSRYDSTNSFTFNTSKYATDLQQLHELLNKVGAECGCAGAVACVRQ
jgi:hypothetical protein